MELLVGKMVRLEKIMLPKVEEPGHAKNYQLISGRAQLVGFFFNIGRVWVGYWKKKVGWGEGSGRVEELNFWSGISGYLIYSRVFPSHLPQPTCSWKSRYMFGNLTSISGNVGYFRVFRVIPNISGYPIPKWLSELKRVGSGIEKKFGSG